MSKQKDNFLNRTSQLLNNMKFLKKIRDNRLGDIDLYQQNQEIYFAKKYDTNNEQEAKRIIAEAEKQLGFNFETLITMKDYSVEKIKSFCSTNFHFVFYYHYPRHFIDSILMESQLAFDDKVLTKILYQQIDASYYLIQKGYFHGNISPSQISWNQDHHLSKLLFTNLNSENEGEIKQIQKQKFIEQEDLFISPIQFNNLIKKQNHEYDQEKDDVFALGLVLLQLGTKEDVQKIYTAKGFDQNVLKSLMEKFAQKHGRDNILLVTTVENMLQVEEEERSSFLELKQNLPPWQEVALFLNPNKNYQKQGTFQHGNPNTHYNFMNTQSLVKNEQNFQTPQVQHVLITDQGHENLRVIKQDRTVVLPHNDRIQIK